MSDYDFSTLNSLDLEELVCDLLNAHERETGTGIIFKTFKEGKDKGIDLLYSTPFNKYEIVGQVKHYYRSGYKVLIKNLKDAEKFKVDQLNPKRYFLATSVDLSVNNAEEIKSIFHPFLKNLSDVYGKKDINKYLDLYPEVLTNHFKLWFSSSEILRKILTYQIEGRSNEFKESELKKKLRLYVVTPSLNRARKVLEKNNFVIITGEPGSGKTITAELLIYEYIKNDYELIYIYDDIKEAEQKIQPDDKKQIFYFDDFLGSNSLEIAKAKSSETALIKILRRISNANNKKFVLTTRTFLLKTAIEESEKLRNFNLKAKESLLQLNEYDSFGKLNVLNNHIEESFLSSDLKDILCKPFIQNFIVNHDNFSPRSVEYVTFSENVENLSPVDFEKFIIENFNYPDEIWRHAYEQQINDLDRFLLNTMLSFGDSVKMDDLEVAFNSRLDYEIKYNNFTRPMHAFRSAFRRLENGFVVQETYHDQNVKFINPSLVDFLLNYLRSDQDEVKRISESTVFLAQLTKRFLPLEFNRPIKIPDLLKKRLLYGSSFFIKKSTANADKCFLSILLYNYFDLDEAESIIIALFSSIENWNILAEKEIGYYTKLFLVNLTSKNIIEAISKIGINMFQHLIANDNISDSIKTMHLLVEKFHIDLQYHFKQDEYYFLSMLFTNLLDEKIDDDIDDLLNYSNAQDFVDEKEIESKSLREDLERFGLDIKSNFSKYGSYDWREVGMDNYFQEQMAKDD